MYLLSFLLGGNYPEFPVQIQVITSTSSKDCVGIKLWPICFGKSHMTSNSHTCTHCLDNELHISAILPAKPYVNLLNVCCGSTHKPSCKKGDRSEGGWDIMHAKLLLW